MKTFFYLVCILCPLLLICCTYEDEKLNNVIENSPPINENFRGIESDIILTNIFLNNIENTVGVLVFQSTNKASFKLFNDNGTLWKLQDIADFSSNSNDSILPFAFSPDNFLLVFKCKNITNDNYEIIVNEELGLKKYIKKNDKKFIFETWGKHIESAFSVEFNSQTNPIYSEQSIVSNIIVKDNDKFYYPVQVKDDWLKIKWGENDNWNYGWIKWRSEKKMLIEIFYFA